MYHLFAGDTPEYDEPSDCEGMNGYRGSFKVCWEAVTAGSRYDWHHIAQVWEGQLHRLDGEEIVHLVSTGR